MLEQRAADAAPLAARRDVGMADQIHVVNRLDADDADQLAVVLIAPELDTGGDLSSELLGGHVRLVPAIGWDHAPIGLGRGVDDREDRVPLVVATGADRHSTPAGVTVT